MFRFQGPSFRCNRIVVIVTLLEAIEGSRQRLFWGNENFHNLYERLLHERRLKSGYLERRIYERPLHLKEHYHDVAHAQEFDFRTGGQEFKYAGIDIEFLQIRLHGPQSTLALP